MATRTLSVTTPYGTFTRATHQDYKFVAVIEARDTPERGVYLAGTRKGDPKLTQERRYTYTVNHATGEQREGVTYKYFSRYHAIWSRSAKGARRQAENYPYQRVTVLGVFEIA